MRRARGFQQCETYCCENADNRFHDKKQQTPKESQILGSRDTLIQNPLARENSLGTHEERRPITGKGAISNQKAKPGSERASEHKTKREKVG
jgi:hypothetical protein